MEILEKEIQIALNPLINSEERDKSTKYFNDFYNSLDSIFLSLRLYLSSNNLTIKFASSIVLRHTLNKIWPKYKDDEKIKNDVHELIIKCITEQCDFILFSYFLFSINIVLSTDSDNWNDLLQFYNFQISEGTEESIIYPIIIASITTEYLSYNIIKTKLIYFLSLAQFSFGVDSKILIIFASRLISNLFLRLKQEDLFHLSGPFEFVMQKWGYSIIEDDNELSYWLNQTVNEVINNQRIPFTADTFMNFLSDLSSRDLSLFSIHLLYHNIDDFLNFYGSRIENIATQIEIILNTASSLFEDGFLNEHSEMLYILNTFETILKTTNAEDTISYLFEYKEDVTNIITHEDRLNELASYLLAILHCVETAFEFCLPYIHVLISIVSDTLDNSNNCIKEISIEIVGGICSSLHYLHDFDNIPLTNAFFGPLYRLLQSENEFVVFRSIRSLIQLLHVASIEPNLVGPMIEVLYKLYDNNINKNYVLEAISSIVFSAEMNVRRFSFDIFKTSKNALLSKDPVLIATGIESLANLLFYCHDILDSKAPEIFSIFLSFVSSSSGDIRSSVAFGFRVFLKNEEKWKSIFYPHFHTIIDFINETLENFICESTRSCLLDVIRLMKVIVKHYSPIIKKVLNNQTITTSTIENENKDKNENQSEGDKTDEDQATTQNQNENEASTQNESQIPILNQNENEGQIPIQSQNENNIQKNITHSLIRIQNYSQNQNIIHSHNNNNLSHNQAKFQSFAPNQKVNLIRNQSGIQNLTRNQNKIRNPINEQNEIHNQNGIKNLITSPKKIQNLTHKQNKIENENQSQSQSQSQSGNEEEIENEVDDNNVISCYEKWFSYSLQCFNTAFIPLHIAAISLSTILYEKRKSCHTGSIFTNTVTLDSSDSDSQLSMPSREEFFLLLEEDFNNESPYISSASINAFAKMTELEVPDLPTDVIIEKAVTLLCKFDDFHKSSSDTNDFDDPSKYLIKVDENQQKIHHHNHSLPMLVRKSIYHYLSVITSTDFCVYFPLDSLVQHASTIDDDDAEMTLYYYAIENLYFNTIKNTKNFSLDVIKNTSDMAKEGRYSYLNGKSRSIVFDGFNKCDLFSWPSSLISLNIITQELFKNGLIDLCEELIQWIERYVESLFKTTYSHQSAYFQTVYPAISIILTFCAAKKIDILKWIPYVIKKFPIKSEFGFADCIFRQITDLYEIAPLKMNPFAPHLLYVFVDMLALPDDEFELFNFKDETLRNVVKMVKKLANLNPQTFVIISSSFLDVNSKPMFERRMAEY